MSSTPLRVVVHAVIRIEILPTLIRDLKAQLGRTFAKQGLVFVDFCVDLGVPKQRPEEYPALELLRRGEADALIVSRTPMFGKTDRRDLLQRLCMPDDVPIALLGVEELRELGLLPPPGLAESAEPAAF
jgi:hypothetical protein